MKRTLLLCFLPLVGWAATAELARPVTLDDAITYGLAHSPTLQQVKEQLLIQKGIVMENVSHALPTLTAHGSYSDSERSFLETDGANAAGMKNWNAGFALRYNVFSGGRTFANTAASWNEMKAAKERVRAALDETLLGVKQAFYGVIIAREIIEVRNESMEVLDTQLKNVSAKRQAGVASDFEVLQAQVAVANERPNLIRAQNDYRVAVNRLASAIGYTGSPALTGEDVRGELKIATVTPELSKLLELATAHRPELRAASRSAQAAKSLAWASGSAYLPSVDLVGGYGWQKSSLTSSLSEPTIHGWSAGVQASWTLFDGFGREARVVQARARARQARAALTGAKLNMEVEVRQAFSDFTQAQDILVSADKTVEVARESLRLSKARFDAGSSTQLDVLTAQSALSQSRLNLLQSRFDYVIARARLDRATGAKDWAVTTPEEKKTDTRE